MWLRSGTSGKYGSVGMRALEKDIMGYLRGFFIMARKILAIVRMSLVWEWLKSKGIVNGVNNPEFPSRITRV